MLLLLHIIKNWKKGKLIDRKRKSKYGRSHPYSTTIFINIKTHGMHQQHAKKPWFDDWFQRKKSRLAQSKCWTANLTLRFYWRKSMCRKGKMPDINLTAPGVVLHGIYYTPMSPVMAHEAHAFHSNTTYKHIMHKKNDNFLIRLAEAQTPLTTSSQ